MTRSKSKVAEQSRRRGIALLIAAWVLQLAGTAAALAGLAGEIAIVFAITHNINETIALFPVAGIILFIVEYFALIEGRKLGILSRQHLSPVITATRQLQSGSFVVYLRSFEDDQARRSMEWRGPASVFTRLQNVPLSGRTEEEQLVAALKSAGPVVALGRPGEALPAAGALRIYPAGESWQETVLDLMKRARLVVMALGPGQGLMWELLEAVQVLPPDRLILLVLMGREPYAQFRRDFARRLPGAGRRPPRKARPRPILPSYPPAEYHLRHSKGWLIRFGSNWKASPVVLDLPWLPVLQRRRQFQKAVSRALQPVLQDPSGPGGP